MELKAPQAGQPITASFLARLVELIGKRIIGGKGVRVERTYQGLVIHADGECGTSGAPKWQPYNGD